MLDFRKVEISDKQWVDELIGMCGFRNCDYSFGNIFLWSDYYGYTIARYKDFALIKSETDEQVGFFYPAGEGDLDEVVSLLIQYACEKGKKLVISSLTRECAQKFVEIFGDRFDVAANRDYSDYIYLRENLANLPGKRFHSKRNHISYFERNNDWSFEPISSENIAECAVFLDKWMGQNEPDDSLMEERRCILRALENYEQLAFDGALIRTQTDGVIAFTLGERLNYDTFCTHFEKAMYTVRGAYPVINREFAKYLHGYKYINREEDLGDEGLRKSKLTYHPDILLNKYIAVYNGD